MTELGVVSLVYRLDALNGQSTQILTPINYCRAVEAEH